MCGCKCISAWSAYFNSIDESSLRCVNKMASHNCLEAHTIFTNRNYMTISQRCNNSGKLFLRKESIIRARVHLLED